MEFNSMKINNNKKHRENTQLFELKIKKKLEKKKLLHKLVDKFWTINSNRN